MQHTEPPAVERSLALYHRLLKAYPPAFSNQYGEEMARVFRDTARDALRLGGVIGLIALWARTLEDILLNALHERSLARQFEAIRARAFALVVDRLLVLVVLALLCFYCAPIERLFDTFHLPVAGWTWGDGRLAPRMALVFVYGLPSIPWVAGIALWVMGSVALCGATPAMKWIGLNVTASGGGHPGWDRLMLWHFASYISGLAFGMGYMWALIDPEGRTWHDILAGVRVRMASEGWECA